MTGIIKQIGQYEIIREIGRGGMGVVYLAKHPTLGIDVALKAMFPDPSRSKDEPEIIEARKRFKNEAAITAKLQHPGIIHVYEYGVDESSGILYISMNYLDGGSLKQLLKKRKRLTLDETLEIVKPIAKALEYIHSQGVIHRDLKPSNIMFLHGNPIIMDFGIARDIERTIVTETGKLVGSIPYMSPERIDEEPFDHRADIYSLGVIIYEMLTGANPFNAETTTGIMKKIATVDPPLLSNVNPEIPEKLASLVNSMIQKDPYKRLKSLKPIIEFDISSSHVAELKQKLERERFLRESEEKKREEEKKKIEKEKQRIEEERRRMEEEGRKRVEEEERLIKQKEDEIRRKEDEQRNRIVAEKARVKVIAPIKPKVRTSILAVRIFLLIVVGLIIGRLIIGITDYLSWSSRESAGNDKKPANSLTLKSPFENKTDQEKQNITSETGKSETTGWNKPEKKEGTSAGGVYGGAIEPKSKVQVIPYPKTTTVTGYDFEDFLERAYPQARIQYDRELTEILSGNSGREAYYYVILPSGYMFLVCEYRQPYPGQENLPRSDRENFTTLICYDTDSEYVSFETFDSSKKVIEVILE